MLSDIPSHPLKGFSILACINTDAFKRQYVAVWGSLWHWKTTSTYSRRLVFKAVSDIQGATCIFAVAIAAKTSMSVSCCITKLCLRSFVCCEKKEDVWDICEGALVRNFWKSIERDAEEMFSLHSS